MCKPVHSISKTLFIWDILRIFVPVARDGRLKGWKLSTAPGGDRLYSWLHWHLTDLLWSPLYIVLVLLSLAGLLPPGFEHRWPPPGCGEESVTENTFHFIFISTLHCTGVEMARKSFSHVYHFLRCGCDLSSAWWRPGSRPRSGLLIRWNAGTCRSRNFRTAIKFRLEYCAYNILVEFFNEQQYFCCSLSIIAFQISFMEHEIICKRDEKRLQLQVIEDSHCAQARE